MSIRTSSPPRAFSPRPFSCASHWFVFIHFDSNINPSLGESDGPAALVVVHGRHAELGLVGHVLDVNHEHVLREVSLLIF